MLSDTPLRSEGVDLRSSSTLLRPALCKVVAKKLSEFGVALFRAPPQSGKTSLGSLMAHHVSCSYVAVTAYYCNFFGSNMQNDVKRDANYQSWGKCCVRKGALSVVGSSSRLAEAVEPYALQMEL